MAFKPEQKKEVNKKDVKVAAKPASKPTPAGNKFDKKPVKK